MKYIEFKRDLWLSDIFFENAADAFPAYPCSSCDSGTLKLKPGSLCYWPDAETGKVLDHIDDESGVYHFKAELKCIVCGESHHVLGYGEVDFDFDHEGEEFFDEDSGHQMQTRKVMRLMPNNFFPAPPILNLPLSQKDEEFAMALKQSFQLFWVDAASCANKIRTAMEYLLDCPPFSIGSKNENGEEIRFNARLKELEKNHSNYYKFFDALRWLGNSGTHELRVSKHHLVKAYEVIDSILYQLFFVPEVFEKSKRKIELAESESVFLSNRHDPKRKQKINGNLK